MDKIYNYREQELQKLHLILEYYDKFIILFLITSIVFYSYALYRFYKDVKYKEYKVEYILLTLITIAIVINILYPFIYKYL